MTQKYKYLQQAGHFLLLAGISGSTRVRECYDFRGRPSGPGCYYSFASSRNNS